jgi:hypothetical protein
MASTLPAAWAQSEQRERFQLSPAVPAVSLPIVVDRTALFSVFLTATSPSLHVELVGPDGRRSVVGERVAGPLESVDATYVATTTNPVPGIWSLDVSAPSSPATTVDVVVLCTFNNAVRLALEGAGDTHPAGVPVRLAFALFDGTARDRELSIDAALFRIDDPTMAPAPVVFTDDGMGADESANDGIYEAFVNPGRTGAFQVQLGVAGIASTGSFRRSVVGTIRVVDRTVEIADFTGRDLDIDHDGASDQIVVSPLAAILEDGDYLVTVRLRGSNGREIERSVEARLAAGMRSADVLFDTADIVSDVGVDGPYHVAEIRFLRSIDGDLVPAGIRDDVGETDAYRLGSFAPARVRVSSGAGTAIGVDATGDGRMGRLDVTLELSTDVAGTYSFSASLTDGSGNALGFVAGSEVLEAGTSAVTLEIPGDAIGSGVGGPYCLSNLVLFGAGQSLVAPHAFTTVGECEPSSRRVFSPAVESLLGSPPRGSGIGQQQP